MIKYSIELAAIALIASTSIVSAQTPTPSDGEKPAVEKKKKKLPYVDLYIVPVGPVPLAQFGQVKTKPAPKKKAEESKADAKSDHKEDDKEKSVPSGPRGFVVLQRDGREYPPRALYLKQGDQYAVLPCAQNSIGSPIRVSLKTAELVFYERKIGSEGKYVYKKYYSHHWTPNQKRILITITKPLKSKYWTKPRISTYDISPVRVKGKSLILVNAGNERQVGFVANGKASRLKSYGKTSIVGGKDGCHLKLGVLNKANKLYAPQRLSFPNIPDEQMLILAFPCTSMESFRGIKTIRGRIIGDRHRKADMIKPKKGV